MNEALAPIIWPLEVGNALVVAERRGRITPAETVRFLDLLYYGWIRSPIRKEEDKCPQPARSLMR